MYWFTLINRVIGIICHELTWSKFDVLECSCIFIYIFPRLWTTSDLIIQLDITNMSEKDTTSFCGRVEVITINKNHPKGIKKFMNGIG